MRARAKRATPPPIDEDAFPVDPEDARPPPRSKTHVSTGVDTAKRAKTRQRVLDLVSRAAHPSTPEEEARTSAVVAARLIVDEKLLDPEPPAREPLAGDDRDVWARTRIEALERTLEVHAFSIRHILRSGKIGLADKPGRCLICGYVYSGGEMIAWKRRRAESAHYTCCVRSLEARKAV